MSSSNHQFSGSMLVPSRVSAFWFVLGEGPVFWWWGACSWSQKFPNFSGCNDNDWWICFTADNFDIPSIGLTYSTNWRFPVLKQELHLQIVHLPFAMLDCRRVVVVTLGWVVRWSPSLCYPINICIFFFYHTCSYIHNLYIYIYYTSALLNGTPSLISSKIPLYAPFGLAFLMKALKIAYVGTNYHGNAWQVAWISCLRWLMRALVDYSYLRSPGFLVRWKSIQRMHLFKGLGVLQLQPNFVVYNRHARNHTSKHPICEKRQPFKYLSGWWFQTFFISPLLPGEMIQFDGCIFVKWVGSSINSNALSRDISNHSNPIPSFRCFVSGSKDLPNGGDGTFWCLTQDAFDSGHPQERKRIYSTQKLRPWVKICI